MPTLYSANRWFENSITITLLCICSIILVLTFATRFAQAGDLIDKKLNYMVDEFIVKEGIKNERVIEVMRKVPRHQFCILPLRKFAFQDRALSIGHDQTISPPFIVAYMTESIDPQPTDKVLEIGTGSGYQAAVLSMLAKEVYTIEIVEALGKRAKKTLKDLKYENVHVKTGDGFKGWEEHAPYDKMIVTCSPEKVPQPLIDQLKEGGLMIIPLGERYQQVFYLLKKKDGKLIETKLMPTLFVPMTGISEENRVVKPNPLNPQVANGSFEVDTNSDGLVDGWHYQRRTTHIKTGGVEGDCFLRFENIQPGRNSHILQGMAIDGSRLQSLRVQFMYRSLQAKSGTRPDETPGVILYFYNNKRRYIKSIQSPQLKNSTQWTDMFYDFAIPPNAKEAIIQIGLNGGIGKLDLDQIELKKKLR